MGGIYIYISHTMVYGQCNSHFAIFHIWSTWCNQYPRFTTDPPNQGHYKSLSSLGLY
jgi:hypothetical protein